MELYALHKGAGLSLSLHFQLWKLLRKLRPAILHTYNLAAIEYAPVARLAGVPICINGTHGRDAGDAFGTNKKHIFLRRITLPFYNVVYANSDDLLAWLRNVVGASKDKSCLLPNGIDAEKFHPLDALSRPIAPFEVGCTVIGTVGRVQPVKDHRSLVEAFILLRNALPDHREKLRLVIVGTGPELSAIRSQVQAAGLEKYVWTPGSRTDVADILRGLSIFAMSSIAEGTPGSALEAMASALPVVGTRVGGIPEVIEDGVTGTVVEASDPQALADALARYVTTPCLALRHGEAGRNRVQRKYNMQAMVEAYLSLYDKLCREKHLSREPSKSCAE